MKFYLPVSIVSLCTASMPLLSQINTPKAGVVRYRSGAVHPVFGLGSSWVVRSPFVRSAVAVAFSDQFGLIADGASLSLLKEDFSPLAKISCVESHPVLGIGDSADTAVAWLPSRNSVITFDGRTFISTPISGLEPGAQVTSVLKNGNEVRLLQMRPDGSVFTTEISLTTSQVTTSKEIGEARGPAAFHLGYICSVYENKLHLTSFDGNGTLDFPLDAKTPAFEQASSKSLHITSPGDNRNWIVYAENGHIALAELPAPAGPQ